MSQLVNVPLESYLLSRKSAPIDCVVCEQENCSSADRCIKCSAPLALSRQAAGRRKAPQLIAVLGASGIGKTVYLGMLLDMLIRRVGGLRATVCGPHSIGLQQETTTALASGWYPDKTSIDPEQWNWVHCLVECGRRRRATEVILADISGDAWAKEADQPGAYAALSALLARAAGVMVLADTGRLHAGDHTDDFVTLKLLSQLSEFSRRRERRPLALVFTKADVCQPCLDEPLDFAESHADGLLQDCESRFPNTRVFSSSIAGASAVRDLGGRRRNVPLRVEPQGVVEPMGWLLTQLP